MPIYQTNIFVCDKCGHTDADTTDDNYLYSDPVIVPPVGKEWGYIANDLCCPDCYKNQK